MNLEHECWWTRRCETELSDQGSTFSGAGVLPVVVQQTASLLGASLSSNASPADEHGHEIVLHGLASGAMHDGCFIHLEPLSPALKGALLRTVLQLHSHYLQTSVDWSRVQENLLAQWTPGTTLRLRAFPSQQRVIVRRYPTGAGLLARTTARRMRIDCRSAIAALI